MAPKRGFVYPKMDDIRADYDDDDERYIRRTAK